MSKMKQELYQKQTQNLMLKPKMLQSLEMLALPLLQLEAHVKMEMINNPMLEVLDYDNEDDNADDEREEESEDSELEKTIEESEQLSEILDSYNSTYEKSSYNKDHDKMEVLEKVVQSKGNKRDDFIVQLDKLELSEKEYDFSFELIDNVNDHGYLPNDISVEDLSIEYSISIKRAYEIHQKILHFKPAGITARTTEECLVAQLDEKNNHKIIIPLIKESFQDLIHRRYQKLASKYGTTSKTIMRIKEEISHLDPKPGLRLFSGENEYVTPDLILKKIGGEYEIILNDYSFPKVRLSRNHKKILQQVKKDKIGVEYLRKKINSAKFLIKSLYLRGRTLENVMRSIINYQSDFFYKDSGFLKPLTYAVIAEELQVNESTISRVVSSKYADTPFGIMCLKEFFTSKAGKDMKYNSVSRHNVETKIYKMIENEEKSDPLSDQAITDKLKDLGINVSRRVVAKYRKARGILNSHLRRKE